ncbi:RagB/SusD family nutrient uptake outer membrane protein [Maribacter sp. HTCC2170]|uniref:RagB/SusD family nutrient uptake outer membrane protein n=1 Tax=Maribacter sp. (strain HTCC2170 / KCCM 42371) TaxID=313603 RepID=UPI0005A17313|nr:RagB/SusD family nutrient uptake outer membrane protein [Maribacter sp. HTCC2170]
MKFPNKSILLKGLVSGLLVFGAACTDLEEELQNEITEQFSVDGNAASAEGNGNGGNGGGSASLLGPYSKLRDGSANHGGYWSVQSVSTDEMAITQKGGDWYDGGIWLDVHRHTAGPTNGPIGGAWGNLYGGVAECNDKIANGGLNANELAQVKALRAFFYLRLCDLYGNVKIVTTPGGDAPQSNRAAVFAFVESELLSTLGIASVSPAMDLSGSDLTVADDKYRINQFAALGVLAKLYLNAEVYTGTARWQEAHDAADYIISNGGYTLVDSSFEKNNLGKRPGVDTDPEMLSGYATVFAPNNQNNPEIIWSIEYDDVTASGMNYTQMTLHYSSQFSWNLQAQPWNGYVALEEFYNSYEDGDARKSINFIAGPQLDAGGNQIVDYSDSADPPLNYTTNVNELEPNAQRDGGTRLGKFSFQQYGKNEMNNDWPIVRLGEMYLVRGEAAARNAADWSMALADVNIIRQRAGVAALASVDADSFLAERGREMFMETTRRRDLIRFGKWADAWWEKPVDAGAHTELMPIPQDQIDAAGGSLTQNPGY